MLQLAIAIYLLYSEIVLQYIIFCDGEINSLITHSFTS